MSPAEQEWCATAVCDGIEANADTDDHFVIVAHNPLDGDRPAAFILSALFGKEIPAAIKARLLPTLAKAVVHAVGEVVDYAIQGIGKYLWRTDRPLALTCIQALVTKAIDKEQYWEHQRKEVNIQQLRTERDFDDELRIRIRRFIEDRGSCDEALLLELDLTRRPGLAVASHLLSVFVQQPNDPFVRKLMMQIVAVLPAKWETEERASFLHSRGSEGHERLDPQTEYLLVDSICQFVLRLPPREAIQTLEPLFAAASEYPEKAANFVQSLILDQADRTPALTFWVVWQRFADDFMASQLPATVDQGHSSAARLLRELFLGADWGQARDWAPLHNEAYRIRALFDRLPATRSGFDCYAYFLAKIGSSTLPKALESIAAKLAFTTAPGAFSDTAVFYLENILSRLIYGGNLRIRTEASLRQSALIILDYLVAAGSSVAYKLRDDFLTPFVD
jgi:hypothetical protein